MSRDGRNVAVSAFHHKERVLRKLKQNDPNTYLNHEVPVSLHKWAELTRATLKVEANDQPIHTLHTVCHEAMLANPNAVLLGCLQHIEPNHPWENGMLEKAEESINFRR